MTNLGNASPSSGGGGYERGQRLVRWTVLAAATLVAVLALTGPAAAADGATDGDTLGLATQEEECYPYRTGFGTGLADGHGEECEYPERPEESPEESPEETGSGDEQPPEVISFEATYDGSGTVDVTVEFDEQLGGGHVVLNDADGNRLGKGRLADDVSAAGHVYDTSFGVPADEDANYTAVLFDADDQHDNAVKNPSQYHDTATVDVTTPTPEPTATATPTPTATPEPTATPTATPTAAPTTTAQVSTGVAGPDGDAGVNADADAGSTTTTPPPTTAASNAATTRAGTQAAQAAAEPSPTGSGAGGPLTGSFPLLLLVLALLAALVGYVLLQD